MMVGAPLSPQFRFAVSQGICILVQCLAGNMGFVIDHI